MGSLILLSAFLPDDGARELRAVLRDLPHRDARVRQQIFHRAGDLVFGNECGFIPRAVDVDRAVRREILAVGGQRIAADRRAVQHHVPRAEAHVRLLERVFPAVHDAVAVQHVVLQRAQLRLVGAAPRVHLVELRQRAVVDAEHLQHMRRELVRLDVLDLGLERKVRPDGVFRRVQVPAVELAFLDLQTRHVVAVDDEHGRLVQRLERRGQRAQEIVDLLQLRRVILHLAAQRFVLDARKHPDPVRFAVGRVRAVRLHRDRVDQIARRGGIQQVEDLPGQDAVLRPADLIVLDVVHVLDRGERVEAELREHLVPVVERGRVVVQHVGRKAELL